MVPRTIYLTALVVVVGGVAPPVAVKADEAMRGAAVGKRSWQKYHGQGRGGHTDVAGGALDLHAYTGTAGSASAVEKTS